MSRIGKRILEIPENVTVLIKDSQVEVKGPKGILKRNFSNLLNIKKEDSKIMVTRHNDNKQSKQLHGTTNSLLQNMILGVTEGFKKEIEVNGVGYKAILKNEQIELNVGYSHPVRLNIMPGAQIEIPQPTKIIVSGLDKQIVGQMAAIIRKVRVPSPYSGKGIMYKGEEIRRKEGKAATK